MGDLEKKADYDGAKVDELYAKLVDRMAETRTTPGSS